MAVLIYEKRFEIVPALQPKDLENYLENLKPLESHVGRVRMLESRRGLYHQSSDVYRELCASASEVLPWVEPRAEELHEEKAATRVGLFGVNHHYESRWGGSDRWDDKDRILLVNLSQSHESNPPWTNADVLANLNSDALERAVKQHQGVDYKDVLNRLCEKIEDALVYGTLRINPEKGSQIYGSRPHRFCER